MIEQTETHIQVRAAVDATAEQLFGVLADPGRHGELDGSGTVRAAATSQPITAVGEVFTMQMSAPDRGDYQTDNHVTEFVDGRLISWMTSGVGRQPLGLRWSWELIARADGRTDVVHTCDWSEVTDPAVLARVSFPRVPAADLMRSVQRLGELAAG